jgi:hypothetical protein
MDETIKPKRTDSQPFDNIRMWGVLYRPPGAPATGSADEVWIALNRVIAERWLKENPGTKLMKSVKQSWDYVMDDSEE